MNGIPDGNASEDGEAEKRSRDLMRLRLEHKLGGAGEAERQPPPIPDHEVLRRIGSGAYGDVWLARTTLGTMRAVKVVYRARFEEDHPYEREFNGIVHYEPISRTHDGLIQVLQVGRNDQANCFYYVMELADAVEVLPQSPKSEDFHKYSPHTLRSEVVLRKRLPPVNAARLALRLAGALEHLHSNNLVHRDIKPSNVIFVGGQPKLADFGLVTGAGSSASFVGTEGFTPPEGPGTPQGDIYGLGKLLYELATGRDRMDFPQLPPGLNESGDGEELLELNEVMTRACAPEPQQRYATATELEADLNLFLAGRSLRRARNVERHLAHLKKFAVASCVFLALATIALWIVKNEERRAADRARAEALLRRRAEAAEGETRQRLFGALLEQARATVRSGELGQRVKALEAVQRASAISNTAALRGVALAARALPDLRFERELPYGSAFTVRLVDPAFERIALCRGSGPVEIRSASDQRLLATLPASTNRPAYLAEWSANGRFLAVKRDYSANSLHADWEVWDVAKARQVLLLHDVQFKALSLHPKLPMLVAGSSTGGVSVWHLENSHELFHLPLPDEPLVLKFSPDGDQFAAFSRKGDAYVLTIHDTTNGTSLASCAFADIVRTVEWHPSGKWLVVPEPNGVVNAVDAQTGESRVIGRHKAEATQAQFTPDGAYLISGGWERELICWEARTLERSFTIWLNGYVGKFRSDGRAYALETETGVQIHAFERASGFREFAEKPGARLLYAAFSADGRWLAAAGADGVGVWDLQNGGPGALSTNGGGTRVCFTSNGELFANGPGAGFRWRVSPAANRESPPELSPLALVLPERFTSLCTASNSVVMIGERGSAVVDLNELEAGPRHWKPMVAGLSGVSMDGRWLALFPSYTPYLFVHGLPNLEPVAILTNASNVRTFQFSPAGDELAVSCRSGVQFWSTTTWQHTRSITNLNNQLYSADAGTMWLTEEFRSGGLHDARTLELLLPLPIGAYPLAVSPDGRRLAVSVDLRRLQVWDLVEMREDLRRLGLDWQTSR